MPELPEIETICRTLSPVIRGRTIVHVQVLERRLRIPVALDFESALVGKGVRDVQRKGKYILIRLEAGVVWVIHLGMTGKLIYLGEHRPRVPHDHIIVRFKTGDELRFHDPRRFGLTVVLRGRELYRWRSLSSLGVDPLGVQWNGPYLYSVIRNSKRRIRDLLLDQTVVAGLGNIYANETLFRAGVRPMRRARTIGAKLAEQVAEVVPKLLREAIRWGGTSFSDYRDGRDRKGKFQNRLKVYNRQGQPCRECSGKIKRVLIGNRSAFYCPNCQA